MSHRVVGKYKRSWIEYMERMEKYTFPKLGWKYKTRRDPDRPIMRWTYESDWHRES